jgi:hypothetical protein
MILDFTLATSKQANVSKVRTSFLGLLVVSAMIISPAAVSAQGVGPDQDSLLPPEVVPLDPSAISKMAPSQSNSPASNFGSVPGLSNSSEPVAPTQSAQDFRKSMFDKLMGQPPVTPQISNPNLQSMQGQMGQMPSAQQPNQFGQFGAPANSPGSGPGMIADNPGRTQSQTLSGGVKSPNTNKPSKLAGLSHTLGTATAFGAAGLSGASSPQGLYSLGLMGVSLINVGLRGGLTHY